MPVDITIGYDSDNSTLTASPSPYYAGNPGNEVTVVWGPSTTITAINGVTISTKDGQSYSGTQPRAQGSTGNWQWVDPETANDTYEYVVSADVPGVGVTTLDPQIINTDDPA